MNSQEWMRPLERMKEGPGQNLEHQLSGNGQKGRSLSAASKVQNGLEVTDAKGNVIFKAEGGHQGQMLLRSQVSREMESDCDRSSASSVWPPCGRPQRWTRQKVFKRSRGISRPLSCWQGPWPEPRRQPSPQQWTFEALD